MAEKMPRWATQAGRGREAAAGLAGCVGEAKGGRTVLLVEALSKG